MPDVRPVPELDLLRVEKDEADADTAADPISEEATIQRPLEDAREHAEDGQQREARPPGPAHGSWNAGSPTLTCVVCRARLFSTTPAAIKMK